MGILKHLCCCHNPSLSVCVCVCVCVCDVLTTHHLQWAQPSDQRTIICATVGCWCVCVCVDRQSLYTPPPVVSAILLPRLAVSGRAGPSCADAQMHHSWPDKIHACSCALGPALTLKWAEPAGAVGPVITWEPLQRLLLDSNRDWRLFRPRLFFLMSIQVFRVFDWLHCSMLQKTLDILPDLLIAFAFVWGYLALCSTPVQPGLHWHQKLHDWRYGGGATAPPPCPP